MKLFSLLGFKLNRPWNNVCWPSSKKTSLPRLKNKDFTKSPYADAFLKGLTHEFGQKLKLFSLLAFEQNRPENNVCNKKQIAFDLDLNTQH